MAVVKDLVIRINAEAGGLVTGLKNIIAQSEDLESKLAGAAKVSGAAFASLTAVVGLSVARFAEFEKGFSATVASLDESSFKTKTFEKGVLDLKNGLLDLAAVSGNSLAELNKGLFDLISSGIQADKAIGVLAAASDLAAAGVTTVDVAVDGLTSSLNAYSLSAEEARNVSEKFFVAQRVGKTTVAELSEGFGLVGSTASELHVSMNELLSAVAAVTTAGVKTNAAYTGMKAVFQNILNPTAEATQEAKRLGVEFNSTALRSKGLKGFLDSLTEAHGYTKESMEKLFRSSEALNIIFSLTGNQAQLFNDTLKTLGDQTLLDAQYDKALVATKESVSRAIQKVQSAAELAAVTLGEQFAPIVSKVADAAVDLIKWFRGLDQSTIDMVANVLKLGIALTGAATALVAGALGISKLITIGKATVAAFEAIGVAARISAASVASFGAIATGGLSVLLLFLPDIITKVKELGVEFGFFAKKTDTVADRTAAAAGEITKYANALEDLKKQQEAMNQGPQDPDPSVQAKRDSLQKQIAQAEKDLDDARKRYQAVATYQNPSGGGGAGGGGKNPEEAKTQQMREEIKKRIELADQEAQILAAKQYGAGETQLALMRDTFEVEKAEKEANLIINDELRAKELANVEAQYALLSEKKLAFYTAQQAVDAEMAALGEEARAELQAADINALISSHQTQLQMESAYQRKVIEVKRAAEAQKLADTMKYGATYAALNAAINSEEVQGFSKAASALVALQDSKNKEMREIGKAAAIVQIGIDTARGAMSAYSALAGIPYVGPYLGIAAAAAVVAYGVEQTGKVMGFNKGGIPTGVGAGDKIPAALERGELVVPAKATQQFLPVIAREQARLKGEDMAGGMSGSVDVGIRLLDNAEEFITVEQQKRQALGVMS